MLQAVMQKMLGPDRSNWGTRVVRVGNIDVRRLSMAKLIEIANEEDSVDVEYEFSSSRECYSVDGCDEEEQSSSNEEGLTLLSTVENAVSSGAFTQALVEGALEAGLTELSNVVVEEVVTEAPVIEVIEITPYPSPAPIATSNCSDSPLRFKVKPYSSVVRRYCIWAANDPIVRCAVEGVPSHCPLTCGSCNTCIDSSMRFKVNSKIEDFKSCDWVGRKNVARRCSMHGVSDTCRDTCETCPITTPPSIAPAPPLASCSDSPMRFKVQFNGKLISKNCSWVSNHPNMKCGLQGVPSHCPATCGSCGTCIDSSVRFQIGDNESFTSCEWVGRKVSLRCGMEGISDTCRNTCGICCADSSDKFTFTLYGKTLNKSCDWAGRTETFIRCKIAEVASNCPKTCGNCST